MDASYPPFGMANGDKFSGLDVDLANEIARRLGVRVQIVNRSYDSLYDDLHTGQMDVVISALSIDPQRIGAFQYSRAYFDAGQVLVSRDGTYTTMRDLEGRTVAVEYGSGGDELARLWTRRLHRLNVTHFTTSNEAIAAAAAGQADVALVDAVTARLYVRDHPGLSISQESVQPDYYAVAMRYTSFGLAGAIDYALRGMEEDGTLDAILRRWL
jgi:polar amino acid transport system substrate-binding protein